MRIGSTVLMRLSVVLSVAALLATPSRAMAACAIKQKSQLASNCAMGWIKEKGTTSSNFNPWPAFCENDQRSNLGLFGDQSKAQVVNHENCPEGVTVERLLPLDHMAEVSCGDPSGKTVRVNLDSLACSDSNTHSQLEFRHAPEMPITCPASPALFDDLMKKFDQNVISEALTVAERQRYQKYEKQRLETQARADEDMRQVSVPLMDLTDPATQDPLVIETKRAELYDRLNSAKDQLKRYQQQAWSKYGKNCDDHTGPSTPDVVRAQRACRLLNAAVDKAIYFLNGGTPSRVVARVSQFFKTQKTSADFLAARTVFFYGYSEKQRNEMMAKDQFHFVRQVPASEIPAVPDQGKGMPALPLFKEPGNGYVFGGDRLGAASGHGQDCSSFSISRDLISGGLDSPPTSVLRDIARKLQGESVPDAALGPWAAFKNCFSVVDLRKGQSPHALDLVVSVTNLTGSGHVTVVKSFDSKTGEIVDLEAKGGDTGSIVSCARPLFEPACATAPKGSPAPGIDPPPVRSDLYVLRFKEQGSAGSEGCPVALGGK